MTTHEYDDAGQLIRSVTREESEWDEWAQIVAAEYRAWRADLHTCGRPLSETVARANGEAPPKYYAGFETCTACEALEEAQRAREEKDHADPKAPTAGRLWQVYTADEVAAMAADNRTR